ncbi:shikimate dehydrogenase [soil metagenome]
MRVVPRAAVLGQPVGHSLSPVLHRAALAALGLADWRYDAIECDADRLPAFLAGLDPGWVGLSLTMPLKRAALEVASSASDLARSVGAANTLLPSLNGWHAENTDVVGICAALADAGVGSVSEAVVLGAGGTAQAALAALAQLGCSRPRVLVRDPARAVELMAAAGRLGVSPVLGPWPARGGTCEVVISMVPAGAADALALGPWPAGGVLLDVVYVPWPTPLAVAAAAAGVQVVGGLPVLPHQARAQVQLFTGRPAPRDAMRAALAAAVPGH